jgi:putative ABC transport system substrate-binding protein
VALAERHRLPAIYYNRRFVDAGGLMSYGIDQLDTYRQAASYVDRILRGAKPGDLPVQAPTKYELVLNLRPPRRSGSRFRTSSCSSPTR